LEQSLLHRRHAAYCTHVPASNLPSHCSQAEMLGPLE
jgi:hypothetical protein